MKLLHIFFLKKVMRSMDSSRLLAVDLLHSSFYSARQIPLSSTFHRTRGGVHRRRIPPSSLFARPSEWSKAVSPNLGSSSCTLGRGSEEELGEFMELLPARMRSELSGHPEVGELIEVVMDLGREPLARFPSGDWVIADETTTTTTTVTLEDLMLAVSKLGDFSVDNRSGINSSLHRISAIRNRKSQIIGLTCRVGRAVSGSAEIIRDLVESGGSILVIGHPGVGKTTLIREIARMLADDQGKRVVIVDTSNEIGGDGDVPHSGIGRARRMQVPNVNMQHNVMIEAVENHMPQTIIIDEIGTELEALAACTIAQRGVQLVGTAHGMTIENIMKNPSLQILVGGIESVTLGDEEARKRKVQKTVLERKGPPAFTCAVELISKNECRIHHRLDATIDALLSGKTPLFEIRQMEPEDSNNSLGPAHLPSKVNADEPQLVTIDQEKGNGTESDKGVGYHQDQLRTRNANRSIRKRTGPSEPQLVTVDQEKGNEKKSDKGVEYHQDQLRTRNANRSIRKRTGPSEPQLVTIDQEKGNESKSDKGVEYHQDQLRTRNANRSIRKRTGASEPQLVTIDQEKGNETESDKGVEFHQDQLRKRKSYRSFRKRTGPSEPQLVTIDQEEGNETELDKGVKYHQDQLRTRKAYRSFRKRTGPFYVYTYKILEADLLQVANVMGLEDKIDVVADVGAADAILASISELKQNPWIRTVAKFHQIPTYVIKSNATGQMVKAIHMILGKNSIGHAVKRQPKNSVDMEIEEFLQKDREIEDDSPEKKPTIEEIDALEEVRLAIEYIVIPGGEPVELLPRRSEIIARQLKLVESYQLSAENSGTELNPRLQILPHRKYSKPSSKTSEPSSIVHKGTTLERLSEPSSTVSRLPLLPE